MTMGRSARLPGLRGPLAAPLPTALGSAPPRGWLATASVSAPGLCSVVRSPCRAPGLQEELEPGCSTTPRPGTRRPGVGSAGQVTCIGPGWGLREARGRPFPDFCPRGGPRRGRKPRWVWSARAGEKLRCDQSQQAPPERPAPHGHPVVLLPRLSPASPSPCLPHPEPWDHHPLARRSPTVALAGTFRDLLAAEASLEPRPSGCSVAPSHVAGKQAAENSLRLLGNCNRFVTHFR